MMLAPDVVIPVRPGDTNPELRYTLRSLANVPHGAVHVVGYAPRWVSRQSVNVIPVEPRGAGTVVANMAAAVRSADVADSFLLFNDDFYVTRPIPGVPVLNRGRVNAVISRMRAANGVNAYVRGVIATRDHLAKLGYSDPWSFELHVPMLMRRSILRVALAMAVFPRFNWRTAYGALAGLSGTTIPDVKVYRPTDPIPAGPFLYTSDRSFRHFAEHVADLFPEPCEYEK